MGIIILPNFMRYKNCFKYLCIRGTFAGALIVSAVHTSAASNFFDGPWEGEVFCEAASLGGLSIDHSFTKVLKIEISGNDIEILDWEDYEGDADSRISGHISNSGRYRIFFEYEYSDPRGATETNQFTFAGKFWSGKLILSGFRDNDPDGEKCKGALAPKAPITAAVLREVKEAQVQATSLELAGLEAKQKAAESSLNNFNSGGITSGQGQDGGSRQEQELQEATQRQAERAKQIAELEQQRKINEERLNELTRLREDQARELAEAQKQQAAEAHRLAELKRGQEQNSLKLAALERQRKEEKNQQKYADVDFGNYHALVIGNNDYKYLKKLNTAVSDATAVAGLLRDSYGYKVRHLENATRSQIFDALDEYRETLTDNDNLLIYYAGHGWLDDTTEQGFWLPINAKPNRRTNWIPNSSITGTLMALEAKHVMVVADSCYSGTLVRSAKIKEKSSDYVAQMAGKRARLVLTSGGVEPVADSDGTGHSPFASVFLDVLKGNKDVIDGTQLFSKMRRPVMLKADQTPEYSDVRKAGHEGGDFLFVRRR
jgi:hypothetical protein